MSSELSVILQNSGNLIQTGLDEDTLAVAGGFVNQGSKRISIRGKAFRKVVGGKEVSVSENNYMDMIIVKMAHTASRTFYAQSYKEGEKISPTCWSSDSRVPDIEVKTPQSKTCDVCNFSAKNSGSNGTGTACRLSWRMAVVLPSDPAGDVMQLVLPATSCFGKEEGGKYPFRPYVQLLANNNVSAGRVVTKMQFDAKASTPKILFSPAAAVNSDDIEVLQRQGKSAAAENAVKLTVFQTDSTADEFVAPSVPSAPQAQATQPEGDAVDVIEPILRDSNQAPSQPITNASDVMKKWSTKS